MKVPARSLKAGDTVRVAPAAPPQVILDRWLNDGLIHLVFDAQTSMLRPDDMVIRLS